MAAAIENSSEETLRRQGRHGDQQPPLDGGETGKSAEQSETQIGFWSNELRDIRREVFKKWGITSMYVLCSPDKLRYNQKKAT